MPSRYGNRSLFGWPCWSILAVAAAAALPIAGLFMSAVEGTAKSTEPAAADLLSTTRIDVHPVQLESSPAATGKLVVRTYDLAELVEKFRKEVDERESSTHLALEWFVKRAAPGPWKTKGFVLADPCQIDRLSPGMENIVKANESARFELGWVRDKLIVVHTAAGQEQIAERLQSLIKHGFSQLSVEVRIISGPTIALDKVCEKWQLIGATANDLRGSEPHAELKTNDRQANESGSDTRIEGEFDSVIHRPVPAILALLEDDEARTVIQAAQDSARTSIMFAPKVTLFNSESACIEDTTQRPFVVGVRAAPGGGQRPQVQVVSAGTSIRVKPVLLDDDKVQLDLGLTLSDIRNVETVQIPIAGEKGEIGIQIPEVVINRLRSNVEMRLDQMLAIAFPAAGFHKTSQPGGILVKVRKIDESLIANGRLGKATIARDEPALGDAP